MTKFNNLLLFGGETNNENLPTGFYSSLALLSLRGKPIILRQLENLKNSYGLNKFIIAVCNDNPKLLNYIKNILYDKFEITIVQVNKKKSILSSLKYALKKADFTIPTRVILGDTFIPESIDNTKDIFFTSKDISYSENWCLIDKNGIFYDKQKNIDLNDKEALVGYYSFSDTEFLYKCCLKARLMLKKEISAVLKMYQTKHKLKTRLINDWYDLGHTSKLIKAQNILFNTRCFNSVSVDSENGSLIKRSTNIQKLEAEAFWYQNLPEKLKVFAPRILNFSKNLNSASLTMELYGYPTLQELYITNSMNIEDWQYIISLLFKVHKKFENYTKEMSINELKFLYYEKTKQRICELKNQNPYWEEIFERKYEHINGKEFKGITSLKFGISNQIEKLCRAKTKTIIHGDYCFSNILFDSNNYNFKFIDPRGIINNSPTIYGDPRYDIAKLRHSVVGLYDFIVQDLFKLNENKTGFEYKIIANEKYSILEEQFNKQTIINGYNIQDIKFIEGLLFLSMIPLHKDNIQRQKIFYLKAIELLNNILDFSNEETTKWKKENSEYVLI